MEFMDIYQLWRNAADFHLICKELEINMDDILNNKKYEDILNCYTSLEEKGGRIYQEIKKIDLSYIIPAFITHRIINYKKIKDGFPYAMENGLIPCSCEIKTDSE